VIDPTQLPDDLPAPEDDGATDHLRGTALPAIAVAATDGSDVRLDELAGTSVVFAYPRTGEPGQEPPGGEDGWNAIRGARIFGLSTQDSGYQREAVERLHLPYPILSDEDLELTRARDLPTFDVDGLTLIKRVTLIVRDGVIADVVYPVFPPDRGAELALERL
jgi:peroxiredoxin